jgi:hypothetical protein
LNYHEEISKTIRKAKDDFVEETNEKTIHGAEATTPFQGFL